jgi:hypothetical protein
MPVVNHVGVARVFIEAVQTVWPDGVKSNNSLLSTADAAQYRDEAAVRLSYPKLIHVTCVTHDLHRVKGTIRVSFPSDSG